MDSRKGDRHKGPRLGRKDYHKPGRERASKCRPFLAVDGEGWGTDGTTVLLEPAHLKALYRSRLAELAVKAEDDYYSALTADRPDLDATGGRIQEPPPRIKIEDRFGGGWRAGTAEYDWFWELHPLEQSRIRGSWFQQRGLKPDEVEAMGLSMADWLLLTRSIEAARLMQQGRKPGPKRFGGRNPLAGLANRVESCEVETPGRQHYQQMTAASDEETFRLDMGRPLRTHECLSFLYSLPKDRVLVAFSFGYDVAMILRDLPPDKLHELHDRDGRTGTDGVVKSVFWEGWLLDWLPRKQFKLGRLNQTTGKVGWRIVSDCFGFFGRGFASVLEEWPVVSDAEREAILEGKARRQTADHDRATEAEYSRLECVALCRIMDQIRKLCADVGYPLTSYYGGGSIAGAMLKAWGVRNHTSAPTDEKDTRPNTLPDAMRVPVATAYMGGRFETAIYGEIPQAYVYDIRSAYPSVMRSLPCLAHGHWSRTRATELRDTDLWRVSWSGLPPRWGPLGVRRSDGRISFPASGEGWYWGSEVRAARNYWTADDQHITLHSGWRWHQDCDHQPFARVQEVYDQRARLKAQGDPAEKVLKIGINSLYGKTAQAIGQAAYHDYCWAGMITAKTRAMLLEAIAQKPEDIVGTATDSITSLTPLELDESGGLGTWEAKIEYDLLVVQNGVQSQLSKEHQARTRGMGRGEVPWNLLRREWRRHHFEGHVEMSRVRFCGLAVAMTRNRPELMGRWLEESFVLTFGDPLKRLKAFPLVNDGGYHRIPTLCASGINQPPSRPYKRLLPPELLGELAYQDDDG